MKSLKKLIPQKVINCFGHLPIAFLSNLFYRFPSSKLKIIGVTGTDGKTTTVNLIYHILKQEFPVGMVSTVSAKIRNEEIDTGFHVTAPEPHLLQKLLLKMVREKIKYAVLEVTSHGLDQFRLWGVKFQVGVITNVTRDHLDYHKTYEEYLKAKARLFNGVKVAVLNGDDRSFEYLATKQQSNKATKIVTYGIKNKADFMPSSFEFKTPLPGEYNQYNCLAAIAVCSVLGVPDSKIKEAIASFNGVTGRMEEIKMGQEFKAIVDFAHTPNGLEQALKTLRQQQSNKATKPCTRRYVAKQQRRKDAKLIVVFGCAGLRDKGKRPMMGKIAAKYADLAVLTAEDPRTEDVNEIIRQISEGCEEFGGAEGKTFFKIPDRQKAIDFAVNLAEKDDIVVVCGKGHEKSMCFGTKEYPWSDQESVRKALSNLKKGGPA